MCGHFETTDEGKQGWIQEEGHQPTPERECRQSRAAGFQTCRIAGFPARLSSRQDVRKGGRRGSFEPSAGLETGDTADLEICQWNS
jgi:hypothetical protein